MKKLAIAALLSGASIIALSSMQPALADSFSFGFRTGNVEMAYRDGYYDRHHHWHHWRSDRHRREWQARYADRYRDSDHDGVPNRFDDHPHNPFRD